MRDLTRTLEGMNCGLEVVPSLHLATTTARARALRRDYHARRRAGLGGRLLDAGGVWRKAGVEGKAAILTAGNAVVNPFRATHALARSSASIAACDWRPACLAVTSGAAAA